MNSPQITTSRRVLAASIAAIAASFAPVPAAIAEGFVLEEVVVTARRREESLQETPVAVSAFGQDEMRAAQISGVGDLVAHVPGLTRREGRKEADLAIRGVGTRVVGAASDPGVGVYVDNIFIPRSDSQLVDAINLQSMQVLRGPQGTLFGKNTAGGALLLTTRKPGQEYEGFATGNFGDLDRTKIRIGHSGPLTDALSAGLVLDYAKEDGFREDAETGREYGDTNRKSVLAQFNYAGDTFTGDLMLFWGERKENIAPNNCILGSTAGALQQFTAPGDARDFREVCQLSQDLIDDEEVIMDRSRQPWEMTNYLAGMTLSWDIGEVTVKSITGFLYQDDIKQSGEVDSTPVFVINNRSEANRQLEANGISSDEEQRTFYSQEFQLVGDAFDDFMSYTVGVFASKEEIESNPSGGLISPGGFTGTVQPGGMVNVLPPAVVGFRGLEVADYDNESLAVFGQGIFNLSDYWQFTLGARFTEEKKEASQLNYSTATTSPGLITRAEFDALEFAVQDIILNPAAPMVEGDDEWTVFTPAATITMFAPQSWTEGCLNSGMFYLSYSEGFKAGGFESLGDSLLAFDPEEIMSYEFGAKMDLFDQTLRINTSIYYSEYDDIQLRVTRSLDEFTTVDGIINAGEATMTGAEIEVNFVPTDNLMLSLTGSWIDAEYDEFIDEDADGNPVDRSDEEFAYIPETTWTVMAQYIFDLEVGELAPRVSAYYKDEVFIGLDAAASEEDVAFLEDYWVWNARLAFRPMAVENLEVAAYVNNMFDEEYVGTGIISTGGIGAASYFPGRQRSYGVELNYSWN
ncbi:MAG: TonB-dependent receptor [Halioglobus sp.]|nr:TonB-dependent receptor [Halioglobus sp.]